MLSVVKKFLINVLDFIRYKKSFAQDGEDVVLLSFYEGVKKTKGFYVDVGAHHPVRFSNTWLLYKRGWRGINVDPTPGSMRSFRMLRKYDLNLEIGIGQDTGNMTFYCFNEPALNTFDQKVAQERNTGNPYKIVKEIIVPIETLGGILDRYLPKNQQIDVLTIDVEGFDLQVLMSNNWEKYTPKYILVEDVSFDFNSPNSSEVYSFLSEKKYKIVAILKRTIFYSRIE